MLNFVLCTLNNRYDLHMKIVRTQADIRIVFTFVNTDCITDPIFRLKSPDIEKANHSMQEIQLLEYFPPYWTCKLGPNLGSH